MRITTRRTGLQVLTLLGAVCPAHAQSFNVDLGDLAPGVPDATYGAAAEQPGEWNGVPVLLPTMNLLDLDAAQTNVVFTNDTNFGLAWDHPGTVDDDEALLDDLGDPGGLGGTYRFDGLLPGAYQVWTYAWAPDSAAGLSNVTVTGAEEGTTVVGGAWPGGLQEGVTHAIHHLYVTDGSIRIDIEPNINSNFASVNGFQVVYSGEIEAYCSGASGAPCSCGNASPPGVRGGCRHSAGGWMELGHTGTTMLASDNLGFYMVGGLPGSWGVLLQGDAAISWPFKDGILCVGGLTRRVEVVSLDFLGGAVSTVSIAAASQAVPGERRYYQFFYSDPAGPCGSGWNSSNGLQVDWR